MSTTSLLGRAPSAVARRRWPVSGGVLLVLAGFCLPLVANLTGAISDFHFLQLSLVVVYAIAVLGLNLLTGFNGQISLGHGAFFAVGAYVAAVLIDQANVSPYLTLPVAAVACFAVGYLFGLPALRLEGHYLALATFSLAIAVPQILKYRHFEGFTNGVNGINIIKPDPPFGTLVSSDQWMFLVTLAIAALMFWLARNLLDSRPGRAMMAIRDNQVAASTMGVATSRYKATVFGISACYTGVAGALHAIIFEYVAPDSFRFELSIALLVGAVVGGVASLPGAVIGGVFVQVIEKYAEAATKTVTKYIALPIDLSPWTIYGLILIALMFFMPNGIAGGVSGLVRSLARRSRNTS